MLLPLPSWERVGVRGQNQIAKGLSRLLKKSVRLADET